MALTVNTTKVSMALISVYLEEAERDMPLPKLATALCDGDHKRAILNRALGMLAADIAPALASKHPSLRRSHLDDIAGKLPPEALEPEEDGIPF